MDRKEILEAAASAVNGDRDHRYGDPEDSLGNIAGLWNEFLYQVTGEEHALKGRDVAIMMILFKVARLAYSAMTADSWVDIAGYAACGGEIDESGTEA